MNWIRKANHITGAKNEAAKLLFEADKLIGKAIDKINYAIEEFKVAEGNADVDEMIGKLSEIDMQIDVPQIYHRAKELEELDTLPLEDKYKLEPSTKELEESEEGKGRE